MSHASVGVARGILRNAGALFFVGACGKGAGLVIVVLVSRFLGPAAMGLYAVGLGLLPMVRTFSQLLSLSAVMGVAGGMIIVIFFAVWSEAFGRKHLGRIQGAAQFVTVLASAIGPVVFAWSFEASRSYAPLLYAVSALVIAAGLVATRVPMPKPVGA